MPTIARVSKRRYLLQYTALELLLTSSKKILLNFPNQDRGDFLTELEKIRETEIYHHGSRAKLNRISFYMDGWLKEVGIDDTVTEAWVNRRISNLEYLVEVNSAACRNIYDLSQYLVLPWVAGMNNEKEPILRDLSKTLGALGSEDRRKIIVEKYRAKDPFNPVPPFFFGTHYSSPGVIFNFLIRLSPFT